MEANVTADAKPRIGDPAPVLALPTESGDDFRLEDQRGQPILVSFLSHAA